MNVIIYSTPGCSWCTKLKEWLRKHRIKFKEIDISVDLDSAKEIIEKSGQMAVPVTEIDDQIVVGFNIEKLKKLLKIKE